MASRGRGTKLRPSRRRGASPSGISFLWGWIALGAVIVIALAVVLPVVLGSRADTQEGNPAPDFTLTSADGEQVSLSGVLQEGKAAVLVFYRGYF